MECFKEIDDIELAHTVKPRYDKIRALPVWDYNLGLGNANYLGGGENPTGWYYLKPVDQTTGIKDCLKAVNLDWLIGTGSGNSAEAHSAMKT